MRTRNGIILSTAVVLGLAVPALAATLTVDLAGGGNYKAMQPAIDAAADGDTVLVKPGEYVITEPIDFNRLHNPGDPLSPPVKNIVVKSEGGPEVTTIRMAETPTNPERASVVVFENAETDDSVLDGFTITDGAGTRYGAEWWQTAGGGILSMNSSSPTITNCTISGNSVEDWGGGGGGVHCGEGSSPTLTNCTITGNTSATDGGGVRCWDSSPTLTNCTIMGNSAGDYGGGVRCRENASPTLTNCTISGNSAHDGGGVCCRSGSSTALTNCTITGNWAWDAGGGVFCLESSATLTNCTITGNSAQAHGGGVFCWGASSPTLTNCTISGNLADYGGGVCCSQSSPTLTNCIVWGNAGEAFFSNKSNPVVIYSCLEGDTLWPGEGNIKTDPLLVQPGHWDENGTPDDTSDDTWIPGDYHLQPGSPCIDAGTSDGAPTTDIEGNGRPCGAGVDIGAYEFGNCWPSTRLRRGDANASGRVDIADAISVLGYLFGPADDPSKAKVAECVDAADANDDGKTDIADAIKILGHLFASAGPLPAPFDDCGTDLTVDGLDCSSFAPCE